MSEMALLSIMAGNGFGTKPIKRITWSIVYFLFLAFVVEILPATPATAQVFNFLGCSHATQAEHNLSCVTARTKCVDKNRRYRWHELTHCKIRYNQCLGEWGRQN
jgi:hypothetical protein